MEKRRDKKEYWSSTLECVRIANESPDKLSEEGKRALANDIVEEMPLEKLDKFLKEWGYNRDDN